MEGRSYYRNKTVVVSAADTPLGRALCLRLADLGATAVALGGDEAALIDISRHDPARIQPLQWGEEPYHRLQLMGQMWGEEPLHLIVSVLARLPDDPAEFRRMILFSRTLVRAMARGMKTGRGRAIVVYDDGGTGAKDVSTGAENEFAMFSEDLQTAHSEVRIHALYARANWTEQNLARAVDLLLMLGDPVACASAPGHLSFAPLAD